jgi:hypothetical protein
VHHSSRLRASLALAVVSLAILASVLSCAAGAPVRPDGSNPSSNTGGDIASGGGSSFIDVDGATGVQAGPTIAITPANPVVDVTVVNGMVTAIAVMGGGTSITFHATADGASVAPMWSIDRGELGSVNAASGEFTTTGKFSGVGKISASLGGTTATTTITIRVHATQNGRGNAVPIVGVGGVGGVGGEGLGGPVDDPTRMRLQTGGSPPASAQEFGWLYPYDKTVWPRGIPAPLLQWQTNHPATAVYVHLKQANYEFEGFYSGNALAHHPIDAAAWSAALYGNGGDPLHVEIKIADATNVYGPIAEDWVVAPGVLKGTVYYNSYSTALAVKKPGTSVAAAVLAIKPGSTDPVVALPGAQSKCIVCHNVSDDGSTLFAVDAIEPGDDYTNGVSYDLTKGGSVIQRYSAPAADATTNNRKFLWAALSKDGTYALQSAGNTQEAYPAESRVFRRDNGSAVTSTGFDSVVTQAVTPAFSRDGKMVAFNYWQGTLPPGGGNGHTLDMMDFACGTPAAMSGAPSCGTFGFSNLRRLYTNPDNDNGFVGWPAWLPDSSGIVFHNVLNKPSPGSVLATWNQAKAQLWFVDVPAGVAPAQAIPMRALNGIDSAGNSILPKIGPHDDDYKMNYEPTVNPIPSGGYFWVVFTTRRAYGNIASGDPFDNGDGKRPIPKKLWVAAIDQKSTPGQDPSHPAFYLPGQELGAGNMRGFWVVDPCHADGASCETGDECCNGYCRADGASGKLVCGGKPPGCAQEYEKCSQSSECCGIALGFECINGFCAQPSGGVK